MADPTAATAALLAARSLPPGPNKVAYHAYLTLLVHLLPHRGLETKHRTLSQDRFFAALDQDQHVAIPATATVPTAPGAPVGGAVLYVIFRTTDSSKSFRDVLDRVLREPGHRARRPAVAREVVLVAPSLPFTSYTRTAYEKVRSAMPKTRFLAFEHRVFAVNLPACTSFDPHRVLSPAEIPHVLGPRSPEVLPRIFENDPALAWTGGKPGDVVEVRGLSDSCGEGISFRLVKSVDK